MEGAALEARAGFGTVEAEVFGSLAPPEQIAAVRRGEADQLAAIGATDAELALARRAALAAAEAGPDALLLVPSFGIVAIA